MKKICLFLALALMATALSACGQPADNTSNSGSSSVENPVSSSTAAPAADKTDEIIYLWYHYIDQYGSSTYDGIALDAVDCSILMRIARETEFTTEEKKETPTKLRFCIRYFNNGENDYFFADGNAQYVDLTEKTTNDHVDVKYWISYGSESIVMEYKTAEETVRRYAPISEATIQELTEYFATLEDYLVHSGI